MEKGGTIEHFRLNRQSKVPPLREQELHYQNREGAHSAARDRD